MKKLILLIALTLTLSCCNKDDNPPAEPLSQLPPATQSGAGTFGCLVNGVPYVDNSGDFNCFYQLIGGEYYFSISPNFNDKTFNNLGIGCRNVNFINIQTFDLAISNDGGGRCNFFCQ